MKINNFVSKCFNILFLVLFITSQVFSAAISSNRISYVISSQNLSPKSIYADPTKNFIDSQNYINQEFNSLKKLLDLDLEQTKEFEGYRSNILTNLAIMFKSNTLTSPDISKDDILKFVFYPIAGSPMHLGHMIAGIYAKAKYAMHQTYIRLQGKDDRKPDLLPYETRLGLLNEFKNNFLNVLGIANNEGTNPDDGEHGFFRKFLKELSQRYPDKSIEASYTCGADHAQIFVTKNGVIQKNKSGAPQLDTIGKMILMPYLEQHDPGMKLSTKHTVSLSVIERKGYSIRNPKTEKLSDVEKEEIISLLMLSGNYSTSDSAKKIFEDEIIPKFNNFNINIIPETVDVSATQVRNSAGKILLSDTELKGLNDTKNQYGIYSEQFISLLKTYIQRANFSSDEKNILLKMPYSGLVNSILSQEYISDLEKQTRFINKEFDSLNNILGLESEQITELDSYRSTILENLNQMDSDNSFNLPDPKKTKVFKFVFYPIAGSPMHLGHMIAGLYAKAKYKMNQTFIRLQGKDDRKPDLLPYETRIGFLTEIKSRFNKALGIAANESINPDDGEHGFFRKFLKELGKLYPDNNLEASYTCGADHADVFVRENGKIAFDKNGLPKLDTIGKMILMPYLERKDPSMSLSPNHTVSLSVVQRKGYVTRYTNPNSLENPTIKKLVKNGQVRVQKLTTSEKKAIKFLLNKVGKYSKTEAEKIFANEILPKFSNFNINLIPETVDVSATQVRKSAGKIILSDAKLSALNYAKEQYGIHSAQFTFLLKSYIEIADLTNKEKSILLKMPYSGLVNSILSQKYALNMTESLPTKQTEMEIAA
ncbi:MAG: hypothetical protein ACD_79C00235G0001 [uncultured bacterium]|nr:MAG: hypothetical protein ACD_79C00235G0001 [uncultured bacterium]